MMKTVFYNAGPRIYFYLFLTILFVLLSIAVYITVDYYISIHKFDGLTILLLFPCLIFTIWLIRFWNIIYKIDANDEVCVFYSMRKLWVIKISDLNQTHPLKSTITLLYYKGGCLFINANSFQSDNELDSFITHVKSINNDFCQFNSLWDMVKKKYLNKLQY